MAYQKNNVDWEARQQQEKEKQERINILACQNSAIEILKNGLNVEDVKSVTLQLLENSDTLLYGDTSEEEQVSITNQSVGTKEAKWKITY